MLDLVDNLIQKVLDTGWTTTPPPAKPSFFFTVPDQGWRTRYGGRGTEEFVESQLAIDPASQHADNVTGASGRMGPSA